MVDDYRCEVCDKEEIYHKPHGETFPEKIQLKCCKDEKLCDYKRVWNNKGKVVQVAEGLHGNASNGYTSSNCTYMPAGLTPMNKVYGRYGRISSVESEHE